MIRVLDSLAIRHLAIVAAISAALLTAVDVRAQVELDARPGPPGSIVVHAEGVWSDSGVPVFDSIERDGTDIHLFLSGQSSGLSAETPWRFDTVVDALLPGTYTVLLHLSTFPGDEPVLAGSDEVVVEVFCRGFAFPNDDNLCLQNGRFQVRAWYRVAGGEEQRAHPHGLTPDSGSYWFFRNDNLELFIKVLDACDAFDRFWVFASGLTNVGVRIEVTDILAEETWSYSTEPGEGFESVRDTDAFATCGFDFEVPQ